MCRLHKEQRANCFSSYLVRLKSSLGAEGALFGEIIFYIDSHMLYCSAQALQEPPTGGTREKNKKIKNTLVLKGPLQHYLQRNENILKL